MTLTIDLTPQEEAWLNEQARKTGVEPAEVVRKLVDERLPTEVAQPAAEPAPFILPPIPIVAPPNFPPPGRAVAYLVARLRDEATDDPEEIRQAQEELDEIRRNLNAERALGGAEPIW